MEPLLSQPGTIAAKTGEVQRIVTFYTVLGAISVTLFVMTEIVATSTITVWAVAGYFHLSKIPTVILAVIATLLCLWVLGIVFKLAMNAETDPENN